MSQDKGISRRSFLKKGAGAGLGAIVFPYFVPASALGKDGREAPSNRLVAGIIGIGSQGTGNMKGFLHYKKYCQVVALCDVDKKHLDRARQIVNEKYSNSDCETYHDFRRLLERDDLDIASIALPDHWHGIIYSAAARKGLDIYAEKPMARTISQGRKICRTVKKYGVIWQTGSHQRSDWKFHRACELAINRKFGKIHKVEVGLPLGKIDVNNRPAIPAPDGLDWDFWLGPAPKVPYRGICHYTWRHIRDYSAGLITDMGAHHLDIAQWGLGTDRTGPVEIEGTGSYPKEGIFNAINKYKFICKYANGVEMVVGDYDHLSRGTKWYGEKGWVHVNRSGLWAEPESLLREKIRPDDIHLYNSRNHMRNFLECVKSRRECICPAEVGHRSCSLGLLGEIAVLAGRKLKWDPNKEIFLGDEKANRYLSRPMRSPWHL